MPATLIDPTDAPGQSDPSNNQPCNAATSSDCRLSDAQVTRVLHVINGQHFSGAERVQTHLARCLPRFGVGVDFACLTPDRFPEHCDVSTSKILDMAMRGRMDVGAANRVAKLLRSGDYKLLHAHTPRSAMVASIASLLTGVPWIYHVHSPASADSTDAIRNRINAWIERQCLRNVAHQITVSGSLREHTVAKGFDPQAVTTVHNGVPASDVTRDVFPEVGQTWTLGIIALQRPRKGLEVLLDSLRRVREQSLDVRLRCIGPFETPEYEAEIMQRVKQLQLEDHIEFTGFVKDIPAALCQIDAMVLPSLFGEGLPMVVLEAMATAVPVIATRVEGTPEAVRHDSEGLLAQPGDVDDLALQISRLVRGEVDWHALANNAQQRHAAEFSDVAMARNVATVYERVLAQK